MENLLLSSPSVPEIPAFYDSLLAEFASALKSLEFNPYMPFWRLLSWPYSPQHQKVLKKIRRDFSRVPNALKMDLPKADTILSAIQAVGDSELHALARCSELNVSMLSKRIMFNNINKLFVGAAALVGIAKGLGIDVASIVRWEFVAFLLAINAFGAAMNYLQLSQSAQIVRALDDIISIAVESRVRK